MCDPLTILGLVGGLGSVLFAPKPPDPPKIETPAGPAPTARSPGATIRVGTGADELQAADPAYTGTAKAKTRASGSALGGLGRSSLAL
jgi:hypothetical protein